MGGLSKKAYQFNRLREEKKSLLLDGGALLFKTNSIARGHELQARITAEGIVNAYNTMGYAGVGVSSQDLASGLDFLLEMQKKSQFAWLSANIIDKTTGKPLFKPTISRQINGRRITILGLTDQLPANSPPLNDQTEIRLWQDTLPAIIAKLGKEHDFLILLTNLPENICRKIAETYPAINLIINAKNSAISRPPLVMAKATTLVWTGNQGKYIGIMDISWLETGEKQEAIRQNPGGSNKLSAEASAPFFSYKNRFMAMSSSVPDHPAVHEIVSKTRELVNKPTGAAAEDRKNENLGNRKFIGWLGCRKCHGEQTRRWQQSRHASSLLTLIENGQQFNLNCRPCHVTENNSKDPKALDLPSETEAVGCESCHGPGGRHSDNPAVHKTSPVTEQTCSHCHAPEHDPSFNFARDMKKLDCLP